MTFASRRALSFLLVWHLLALGVSAIPDPLELPVFQPVTAAEPVAAAVAPVLDLVVPVVAQAHAALWTVSQAIRPAVRPYVRALGFEQRWRMFLRAPRNDEYVRLRYYVGHTVSTPEGQQASRRLTELVYPASREDRVRGWASFRHSYRDKAIFTSLDRFRKHLSERIASGQAGELDVSSLAPVVRYFASRFEAEHVAPPERLVRVELWHGLADVAPLNVTERDSGDTARLAALKRYYQNPTLGEPVQQREQPPPLHSETEADIRWILLLVDSR